MAIKRKGIIGKIDMGSVTYVDGAIVIEGVKKTEHTHGFSHGSSIIPDGILNPEVLSLGHIPQTVAHRAFIAMDILALRKKKTHAWQRLSCNTSLEVIAEHILFGKKAKLAINSGSDASKFIRTTFPHSHPIWDFIDIIVKTYKDGCLLYNAKTEEAERLGKKI